jgi:hypothetical protein
MEEAADPGLLTLSLLWSSGLMQGEEIPQPLDHTPTMSLDRNRGRNDCYGESSHDVYW